MQPNQNIQTLNRTAVVNSDIPAGYYAWLHRQAPNSPNAMRYRKNPALNEWFPLTTYQSNDFVNNESAQFTAEQNKKPEVSNITPDLPSTLQPEAVEEDYNLQLDLPEISAANTDPTDLVISHDPNANAANDEGNKQQSSKVLNTATLKTVIPVKPDQNNMELNTLVISHKPPSPEPLFNQRIVAQDQQLKISHPEISFGYPSKMNAANSLPTLSSLMPPVLQKS